MENFVLDLESGELLTVTSSDFAMDSEGRVVRRTSDRSAINVDDGTFRLIDYWPQDDEDNF